MAGNPYQVNNYGNKNVNESNLNFNYKINDKHSLLANYWFNYTEREVLKIYQLLFLMLNNMTEITGYLLHHLIILII